MSEKHFQQLRENFFETVPQLNERVPDVMKGFGQLSQASVAEGALSTKVKELMAVAIAIAIRCEPCIAFHVHDALKAGATRQEIAETVGVAIGMGGGPSVAYGVEVMRAVDEYENNNA